MITALMIPGAEHAHKELEMAYKNVGLPPHQAKLFAAEFRDAAQTEINQFVLTHESGKNIAVPPVGGVGYGG